ncbi:MAG: hypothetical protein J0I41_20455 [Filimonas sp.]|nr:hypothetical protein [Filimonas sp.]
MKKKTERRTFIQQAGLLTTSAWLAQSRISPLFARTYKPFPIPADKGLSKAYIQSLYERGNATTYLKTKNELAYIGMPVGGIGCGTVYAGGDGRLWLWDIFNRNMEGVEPKVVEWSIFNIPKRKIRSRDGASYIAPAKDIRPLLQEFALQIEYKGKTVVKLLREEDWDEIKFEATYPVARVQYIQNDLPFTVTAQLYSPFIPLDENNSGLPATIIDFQITNNSGTDATIAMLAVLENKVNPYTAKAQAHKRANKAYNDNKLQAVYMYTQNGSGAVKQDGDNDDGNMTIACLQNAAIHTSAQWPLQATAFRDTSEADAVADIGQPLYGTLCYRTKLAKQQSAKTSFVIAWYFPNVNLTKRFRQLQGDGAYYTRRFSSSLDVAKYIAANYAHLSGQTMLWQRTWYEKSTLPYWFLERTFLNTSILATATTKRFDTGRFWGWEGVGACEGTCTHVWQYAQAAGRIFPALERDTRARVDLGIAMQDNGGIKFRGELETHPAVDGQAGTILRIYREHQMSKDNIFLQKNWLATKKAVEYLFTLDKNGDGMEDTPVENTLDAMWDGEIAWIVGLCIAAVQAAQLMAAEMNDAAFEEKCKTYVTNGRKNMEAKLYNGEYFIHRPDPKKGRANLGSYNTCHIDQVFGQSWAFQLGLPRVLDKTKTVSALNALWKYNFATDVGPYLQQVGVGRPYALPGEGGMIMNTNPKGEAKPYGDNDTWQLGYFHECMSGFEHQVASHMMGEGMKDEAMVLTRAIHDRYHAKKRNPFNEIECSDHYARAMASYGTFITACGFQYHGPKGYIRFAPQWKKDDFAAAFTAATAWGSYTQQQKANTQVHIFSVQYGTLSLSAIGIECFAVKKAAKATVRIDQLLLPATLVQAGNDIVVTLAEACNIPAGKQISIIIS